MGHTKETPRMLPSLAEGWELVVKERVKEGSECE